jgi:predicted lactoylglutathione lyase
MMFLILSGEGPTDIGLSDNEIGPMTKLIDIFIDNRIHYSLINSGLYTIFHKSQLVKKSKNEIKSLSRIGKKNEQETSEFHKNARALAILAREKAQEIGEDTPLILVLFRDVDGSNSDNPRVLRQKKWKSISDGFTREGITTGVPMIPAPKSEAWILCALQNNYQHCAKLEDESGNDNSPNPLKQKLAEHLGEPGSREVLNGKVDDGEIDLDKITDMDSLTKFKDRLNEVLNMQNPSLGYKK